MSFDNFKARIQGGVVKRVRELTQPAADGRNHAAFAQFASCDVTFPSTRPPDISPKTEDTVDRYLRPIKPTQRKTQIVNFPRQEVFFKIIFTGPQRRLRLSYNSFI